MGQIKRRDNSSSVEPFNALWTDNISPDSFLSALTYITKIMVSTIQPIWKMTCQPSTWSMVLAHDSFLMTTDPYVCTCFSLGFFPPLSCFSVFKHIKCISTPNSTSIIKSYKKFQLNFSFEVITNHCCRGLTAW